MFSSWILLLSPTAVIFKKNQSQFATLDIKRKSGRVNFQKDFWNCCLGQGRHIRELKQQRRRRQRERQKINRFRLAKQKLPRSSRFFCTFLCRHYKLRRENAQFHDLSRTGTQDNNVPFLFLNFDLNPLEFNSKKKLPSFDKLNEMELSR